MQTTRQQKIQSVIQQDVAKILLPYARTWGGVLISVSEVRISPDLSIAHIYLSIFPTDKESEIMQKIEMNKSKIRGELGRLERNQLRIIPEIVFHKDDTLDHLEHIEQLLKNDK